MNLRTLMILFFIAINIAFGVVLFQQLSQAGVVRDITEEQREAQARGEELELDDYQRNERQKRLLQFLLPGALGIAAGGWFYLRSRR